jgi:hypothetical protein
MKKKDYKKVHQYNRMLKYNIKNLAHQYKPSVLWILSQGLSVLWIIKDEQAQSQELSTEIQHRTHLKKSGLKTAWL